MFGCSNCDKTFRNTSEMLDVKAVGFALFGTCPKCKTRQGINSLWRRTSVVKGLSEIKKERKPRMSKKLVVEV